MHHQLSSDLELTSGITDYSLRVYETSTNKHLSHIVTVLFSGWDENFWKEINTRAIIPGNTVATCKATCNL